MRRAERSEVFFRQLKQAHGRAQTPAVFRVGRVLEIFLKMDERARSLDQALKEIIVASVGIEPEMFQYIVRFVVTLIVPTSKICTVEWMLRDFARKIDVIT